MKTYSFYVAEHAFNFYDGIGSIDIIKERIEGNLKGVHGKLELSPHSINEFQLNTPSKIVI